MLVALRFGRLSLAMSLAFLIIADVPAWSQRKKTPDWPAVELSGSVVKVSRGRVEIEAESVRYPGQAAKQASAKTAVGNKKSTGAKFLVFIHPKNTKVSVSGVAAPKFLKPGQYVRFDGKVDQKGNVQGEIGSLAVFVPERYFKPSFKVRRPPPNFLKDAPPSKTMDFSAQGIVVSYSRGKLILFINKVHRITAPVSEDAEIRFSTANYSIIKRGDKITVKGKQFRSGQVIADSVNFIAASKQIKKKNKKTDKPATKKESKKPSDVENKE